MEEYPKIQTVYKRNPEDGYKSLLVGQFSLPEFAYLAVNTWVFSEKVDGMNIRVIYNPDVACAADDFCPPGLWFRGKTDNAQLPAKLTMQLYKLFVPHHQLIRESFPSGICFYGEGYGAGIQKGGAYGPDQDFVLFDIRIGKHWLERGNVVDIADMFGINVVPNIGTGTLYDMIAMTKEGLKSKWGDFIAEGIVARPQVELLSRDGKRIITKIKYRDFIVGQKGD